MQQSPATQDIIVSPAMFKIAPNSKQLLRLALRDSSVTTPTQQKTYRVILTQILPVAVQSKTNTDQVNTKLKISLPIFIEPKVESAQLSAKREGNTVTLMNTGNITRLINQIQ